MTRLPHITAAAAFTIATLAALPGCGLDKTLAFKRALPSKGAVQMNVPGASTNSSLSQALTAGETADFYVAARDIAAGVNGGVLWVFDVIEHIIAQPPTTVEDDTATWGPSEARGLERNEFRLVVVKVDDGHFTYHLDARPKNAGDDAFVAILEGEAFPGDDDRGTGTLDVHWGAARSLDDTSCLIGDIHVAYDTTAEPRLLDVHFDEVADACRDETPTQADYLYQENDDGSGQLDFAFQKNLHAAEEAKPLEEVMSVRARWLADGTGRADVEIKDGEIPTDLATYIPGTTATSAQMSECWDSNFGLTYGDTNPDELEPHLGHEHVGDEASCAFPEASFADLDG